ncbi:MAG: TolC family protein [Armatimonadota bacterium]
MRGKLSICGLLVVFASHSFGEKLTMDEAIRLAKRNNGTLKAAELDIVASKARRTIAASSFFPVVTPTLTYTDSLRQNPGSTSVAFSQTSTQAGLTWRVLDAGERDANLRAARDGVSAQEAQTQQTLRSIIFDVVVDYLETLRAQELEKVANSEQLRSEKVLDQTKTRVRVGDAARREILQAEADALNAKVNAISAKNKTNTNTAFLKAIIGLQNNNAPLDLDLVTFVPSTDLPSGVAGAVELGLKSRPDLVARRKNVSSQSNSLRVTEIDAGLAWSLDFNYSRQFTPSESSNRNASFLLTYPLFDGGRSKAEVTGGRANLMASKAVLDQAEKDARSEIEATYLTYQQDQLRLSSADLALKAAQLNYQAADESQKLGAATLIDVITAQVSLVTAEANYIQASYDVQISQLKLRFVTGLPMPGEEGQ